MDLDMQRVFVAPQKQEEQYYQGSTTERQPWGKQSYNREHKQSPVRGYSSWQRWFGILLVAGLVFYVCMEYATRSWACHRLRQTLRDIPPPTFAHLPPLPNMDSVSLRSAAL